MMSVSSSSSNWLESLFAKFSIFISADFVGVAVIHFPSMLILFRANDWSRVDFITDLSILVVSQILGLRALLLLPVGLSQIEMLSQDWLLVSSGWSVVKLVIRSIDAILDLIVNLSWALLIDTWSTCLLVDVSSWLDELLLLLPGWVDDLSWLNELFLGWTEDPGWLVEWLKSWLDELLLAGRWIDLPLFGWIDELPLLLAGCLDNPGWFDNLGWLDGPGWLDENWLGFMEPELRSTALLRHCSFLFSTSSCLKC